MTFEENTGPETGTEYPDLTTPSWWRESAFGIFVHWGIYSVPAFASDAGVRPVTEADSYRLHRYAEWYANTVRIPGSPTRELHLSRYGADIGYEDLLEEWTAHRYDADAFAARCAGWGAKYLVLTTKHHDGLCLWDTATTNFNAVLQGPRRDLVAETARGARAHGLRFGAYFSGALDWHASDFEPLTANAHLFTHRRNDEAFARYCAAQLDELVEAHAPDILWNDIDWPDGGKGAEPWALSALLTRYLDAVPDGVINDRWGIPTHGHLTREYDDVAALPVPWEATRGIGWSFGWNETETDADRLDAGDIIRLLTRTVAGGGNLLLNIGLTADGEVPTPYAQRLDVVGAWLERYGHAIYGSETVPSRAGESPDGAPVVWTRTGEGLWAHLLDPAHGQAPLPPGARVRVPGGTTTQVGPDGQWTVPPGLRSEPVLTVAVEAASA
ncbi:alpha-L-fucosidase [Occultella kanbiaonis]|uniref:alpha-L-fucosidase n=1 Tax=Occultella kanbiaonis TaxID=2675754 RepID=UPI001F475549|nr:alpha-L-fucosidase [Occultella kanbiaonis]